MVYVFPFQSFVSIFAGLMVLLCVTISLLPGFFCRQSVCLAKGQDLANDFNISFSIRIELLGTNSSFTNTEPPVHLTRPFLLKFYL